MTLSQIQDVGRCLRVGDLSTPKKERTRLLTPEEVAALPKKHRWKDWTACGLGHALARAVLRHDHHDKAQQFRAAAFLLYCGSPHELSLAQLWCEANRDEVDRFLSAPPAQTRAA